MAHRKLVLWLVAFGVCEASVMAACPSGAANEVFCEDFDTYCADPDGGYPGHTPACGTSATPDDARLRNVWFNTSNYEGGTGCGNSAVTVDNAQVLNTPGIYNAWSLPFAGRWPGANSEYLIQTTFRDWVSSTPGNDVLNLHRLIQAKYGSEYTALVGTDDEPLVLSFALSCDVPGKVLSSDGYLELGYGLPTRQNRANTDFVWSPACTTYCNPSIQQGPFPIVCAQGNPTAGGGPPTPAACPANATSTAPIHNALAVGLLAMMDAEPCKCCVCGHGSYSDHPVYYDGQVWWRLVANNPRASSGTVTPLDGAPMPPPLDIHEPGKFLLWHDPFTNGSGTPAVGGPQNWIKLTVKSNSVKIEMTTIETSKFEPGAKYQVYSTMDGLPRRYTGPFDTLRGGVGPGCELASNASWEGCQPGKTRTCIPPNLDWDPIPGYSKRCISRSAQASWVDFDDVSLSGPPFSENGACCLQSGECLDQQTQIQCENALGGTFRGASTHCTTLSSPCCPKPFADVDRDGDVDQADFAAFQRCLTTAGPPASLQCMCFDRGGDGQVDLRDFESFVECVNGPAIPTPATCDP